MLAQEGRMLKAVPRVRPVGALQIQDGRDHLLLVITGLGKRNSVRLANEGRAAGSLLAVRRLAHGVCDAVENFGVRTHRLLRASGGPLPADRFDLVRTA